MTKGKVLQIGLVISLIGVISYKLFPALGLNDITTSSISNVILIVIVLIWVISYLYRVINGEMTFMEQRKRYRKEYDKIMDDKLLKKLESLSYEEQEKLLKDLEDN